jgi:DNA-binding transcriptional LysR family regulator
MRVGMSENFALTCLPALLRLLRKEHPRLRLELAIGTSSRLSRDVEERKIDLAV